MKRKPSIILTIYKRIYEEKDKDLQYLSVIVPLLDELEPYSLRYLISKINSMLEAK